MELVHARPDIDFILTDVRMNGRLDGFDLVEQALVARLGLRTVVLSGYTREATRRMTPIVYTKAITMGSLEAKVKQLLATSNKADVPLPFYIRMPQALGV